MYTWGHELGVLILLFISSDNVGFVSATSTVEKLSFELNFSDSKTFTYRKKFALYLVFCSIITASLEKLETLTSSILL